MNVKELLLKTKEKLLSAFFATLQRVGRILYSWDCSLFMTLSLGSAHVGESFSSAAWRSELNGQWYGRIARPIIDFLAQLLNDPKHCQRVYKTARDDLPEDMRANT